MNGDASILLIGELAREKSLASQKAGFAAQNARAENDKLLFRAKSHVHGLRAVIYARKVTEDKLIDALKAENANHPLASKEAVEAAVEDERVKALLNPDVIKRTYKDGKLPKDAVGGSPLGTEAIA